MLGAFLLFLIFAGLCFGLVRWFRVPLGVAPATSIGLVISVLFLADFAGLLSQARSFLFGLGMVGGVSSFVAAWRSRVDLARSFAQQHVGFQWGLVALLFFSLYLVNYKQIFHDWDEFSHWGLVIRSIAEANTFHLDPNPLYFQDYPPGTALFSYFSFGAMGYSEGGAYFSYALILLAHCIPIWDLARRKGLVPFLLAVSISLVLVRILGHGWSTVLIDHILSVCFAGLLASYFVIRQERKAWWPIAVIFVSLVLAKHAGTSLAYVASATIVIDTFIVGFLSKSSGDRTWFIRSVSSAGRAISMAFLLLPALAMSALWNHHVETTDLVRGYGEFSLAELFQRGIECCAGERELTIIARYLDHWLGLPVTLSESLPLPSEQGVLVSYVNSRFMQLTEIRGYSPLLLSFGLSIMGVATILRSRLVTARLRQAMILVLLIGAYLLFSTVQLLYYLYAFPDFEAYAVASFKRFQNTFFLGWVLSIIAMSFSVGRNLKILDVATLRLSGSSSIWLKGAVIFTLVASLLSFRVGGIDETTRIRRQEIREWVNTLPLPMGREGRVYIVWQGSNGFEFWLTKYEILPKVTNRFCYSLGPPHFSGDIWSCPIDEGQLRTEWGNYDFLLVAQGYADLQRNYPKLLPELGERTDRALLRIDLTEGAFSFYRASPD